MTIQVVKDSVAIRNQFNDWNDAFKRADQDLLQVMIVEVASDCAWGAWLYRSQMDDPFDYENEQKMFSDACIDQCSVNG